MNDLGQFTAHTQRLRRNALIVGLIALAVGIFDIQIQPDIKVWGFSLQGVGTVAMKTILFTTVLYNLIAFLWNAFEEIQKWELSGHLARRQGHKGNLGSIQRDLERIGNEGNAPSGSPNEYIKTVKSVHEQFTRLFQKEMVFFSSLALRVFFLEIILCMAVAIFAMCSLSGLLELTFLAKLFADWLPSTQPQVTI